jgi:glycine cleavage system H protein
VISVIQQPLWSAGYCTWAIQHPVLDAACKPEAQSARAIERAFPRYTEEIRMPDFLETTVDKFIFKVATDRHYSAEGVWAKAEGHRIQVGVSDFLQQRSGDVAFAEVKPQGTKLTVGDEIATIETIKVNISLPSPVNGSVVEVNQAMETTPELINKDPYGEGWLAVVEVTDWNSERSRLLEPQAYFDLMKGQAEEEAKKQ